MRYAKLYRLVSFAALGLLMSMAGVHAATADKLDHWAYKPLSKPPVPAVNDPWIRTPIDAFILSTLHANKLHPSAAADRRTLIRRVTFDLTGLPPTPQEIDAFLADETPTAYEKLIDRLLASPRYGERWARHWLDVVHYGESHGYGMDRPRPNAWPYRDYVIRSFNADKPWARFVQEQIAGDVLFPGDVDGVVALGFVASGPWNQSPQAEQNDDIACKKIAQNLDRDDMVVTTITAFNSTTINCARCHDHKFDPVTQKEYYGLQADFAGVDRADRPYDADPAVHSRRQVLLRQQAALQPGVKPEPGLALPALPTEAELDSIANSLVEDGVWNLLDPASALSAGGATLTRQPDYSVLASGTHPVSDSYTIVANTNLKNITAVRLEVLRDDSLPKHGPGREDNGNLGLSEFKVTAAPSGRAADPAAVKAVTLTDPTADYDQHYSGDWDITKAIDGNSATAWSIYPEVGASHFATFRFKEPVGFDAGTTLTFTLEQKSPPGHSIGRVRLSVTTVTDPPRANAVAYGIRKALAVPAAQRSPEASADLQRLYRLQIVEHELALLPKPTFVYAVSNEFPAYHNFKPTKTPRPVFVLKRGDIDKPTDPALPGAMSCVPNLPWQFQVQDSQSEGQRRAALARWLSDPANVLTWRSIANRVWQYHFGHGLVDTPNDFGHMGARPTHPELLDYLAATLLENQGSLKALHRLILTSAVYRQSSDFDPAQAEIDSSNRFLWQMNRTRLDAEEVRDTVLHVAGKMDETMGGPSVKQFHFEDPSVDLTPRADYLAFDVDSKESCRRSVYRYLFRTLPDPFMESLDCPDASQLTANRNTSVTAVQALAMLNDRFMIRFSEHLANRAAAMSSANDPAAQVDQVYRLAFGRHATPDESKMMAEYATKHGMANACRLVLNSNEFLFVN